MNKQFDQKLHDDNNTAAVHTVISYMGKLGAYVQHNPDQYGVDLVLFRGYKPYSYIEVEVKRVWLPEQEVFPYPTLQIPKRKEKFLKLGKPVEFWILRSDLKFALVAADKVVEMSPCVEVPNKYVPAGEYFYQVPVTECNLVELT